MLHYSSGRNSQDPGIGTELTIAQVSTVPQGNLFCTNCQSISEGATRDPASEVKGQKLSSEGKMKRRKMVSIESSTICHLALRHRPARLLLHKVISPPHQAMNLEN